MGRNGRRKATAGHGQGGRKEGRKAIHQHNDVLYYNTEHCTLYRTGTTHSGFHLDPELASRDEGVPWEGRTRGVVGRFDLNPKGA
jgi:hypothetical protein